MPTSVSAPRFSQVSHGRVCVDLCLCLHDTHSDLLKATCPVSTAGVERVFSGGTSDRRLLSDLDVCLLTLDRARGTEEMVHVGVPLWGVGGVLGGEAFVEAVDRGDGFQTEVKAVVSLERSEQEEGCAAGSPGRSKCPLRVREGE